VAVSVTIAACAALALAVRAYQLSRPGYLLGVTEYDDGVLFGNALRLASGVIPYRDFAMVQPPGSALLMVPVALLAKVTGTAWGLAVARILTVCADAARGSASACRSRRSRCWRRTGSPAACWSTSWSGTRAAPGT
jgi:hypothetical protein